MVPTELKDNGDPSSSEASMRETLRGEHSREIIAKPKGGRHEDGKRRELAMVPTELKDNGDPSSSEP
jgi:hypothetical protein